MHFLDLRKQLETIRPEIDAAIRRVLESSEFILGPEVSALENEIAARCGVRHGVGLNSGTDGLFLSLKALGIGAGDEVITTPFTFIASASMVSHAGARPVFVDIDPTTFNIDPSKIEAAITPKTKAIIPVHLYGQPANLRRILPIAKRHNLLVIEDAAQAIGARLDEKPIGSFGTAAIISFYPGKNLGAYGDAGMIVTDDAALADRLRMLRNHGQREKYRHEILSTVSRLDNLQAAILRVKLTHLDDWTTARQARAQRYSTLLAGTPVTPPTTLVGATNVFHQYTIRTPRRGDLAASLKKRGIPTAIHYPIPLHRQPAFAFLGYAAEDFERANRAAEEVLSLPIYPELTEADQDTVVEAIREFFSDAKMNAHSG